MTWRGPNRRHRLRRRDDDDAWTRGDQREHEQDINERLERLENKVDRLTVAAGVAAGVVAAVSILIPILLRNLP